MQAVTTAMVLAAGLGVRMQPLTLTRPKPLVEAAGKALIDHGIEKLRAAGVKRAVVNVHYLADQIEAWAKRQRGIEIAISDERRELLDTGGGIRNALPLLRGTPFFVLNSDSFWQDGKIPALDRLNQHWNGDEMDCLLLLTPLERTVGYDGKGDFTIGVDGRLQRKSAGSGTAYAYSGAYLVKPELFAGSPHGKFSMNLLWDRAISQGRLFGIEHDGLWLHVGTPEAIGLAEAALAGQPA
ncbi:MAG: nucleotidyltransferase family protein [Rhizobiales bacterium]|nr:nucleotidyltransferase family protein [Hyphomicrobiales bacterium]